MRKQTRGLCIASTNHLYVQLSFERSLERTFEILHPHTFESNTKIYIQKHQLHVQSADLVEILWHKWSILPGHDQAYIWTTKLIKSKTWCFEHVSRLVSNMQFLIIPIWNNWRTNLIAKITFILKVLEIQNRKRNVLFNFVQILHRVCANILSASSPGQWLRARRENTFALIIAYIRHVALVSEALGWKTHGRSTCVAC